MSKRLYTIALLVATWLVVVVALGEATDTFDVYGDGTTTLNGGVILGDERHCLGIEVWGEPGFFDCADPNL